MAYNFTDRLDHLGTRMSEVNGETLLFIQSPDSKMFWLKGVSRGATENQEFQLEGPTAIARLIDFFVDQTELDKISYGYRPSLGDKFKDRKGREYQVVSGPGGMPPVRPTTPSEKRLRVHTSQVT